MADPVFITLLFIHIAFVVAWLGAVLFSNIILIPLMPRVSPEARSDFSNLLMPRAFRYGQIAGGIALFDGVLLYVYINPTNGAGPPLIQAGALIGLAALIVITGIQNSSMRRIQKISTQTAPGQETQTGMASTISGLQNRIKTASRVGAVLLVIVLVLMVLGTNI